MPRKPEKNGHGPHDALGDLREALEWGEQARHARVMDRFYHEMENARREISGEEPLPRLPEEPLSDLLHERETIESYAARPGYQHGDGLEFIEAWRESVTEKIERLERGENDG
jgi:hypothetical protein